MQELDARERSPLSHKPRLGSKPLPSLLASMQESLALSCIGLEFGASLNRVPTNKRVALSASLTP
jgi:hypothetical protein